METKERTNTKSKLKKGGDGKKKSDSNRTAPHARIWLFMTRKRKVS